MVSYGDQWIGVGRVRGFLFSAFFVNLKHVMVMQKENVMSLEITAFRLKRL